MPFRKIQTMKKIKIIAFVLSIIVICSCQSNTTGKTKPSSKQLEREIESYLKEQIEVHEIPGLAVAVVKNNEVIYKGYFGTENLENNFPINNLTTFPVYSISKLISATAIFQLIERGEISLDDTISKYIENLPEKWQNITIANLVTHSSGLPDFSLFEGDVSDEEMFSKIAKDSIHFEKGNQWEYNQTNYWLLSKIIEKVTTKTFDEFVLTNQFSHSKNNVLFSSNLTKIIPHRVYGYDFNDELGMLEKRNFVGGKRAHACNGLTISLDELIKWNTKLDAKYYPIHNTVIEHIAGIMEPKLINKPALYDEKIITEFLKMNFEKAKSNYFKVRDENPEFDYEATLNNLAYALIPKKNIDYA